MFESLKGQFLVAGKWLRDPNFFKTVALIVEHGEDGAMGLVVNRPSCVSVAHALSEHFKLPDMDDLVYVGGPVEPAALFVLHNAVQYDDEAAEVVPGIFVGSSPTAFSSVVSAAAHGDPDLKFRIFSGCAGWAPGQLDGELDRGDWHLHAADSEIMWNADPYDLWDTILGKVYEKNRILPHVVQNPEWN